MNAIIVDDEINNIHNLQALLEKYCPVVNIVGSAVSADDGKKLIQANDIDLLFLDIQMPRKNGFDLLSELPSYAFQVIFVTAFDKYAIKAIKYSALDYLLKPVNYKELITAVKKAEDKPASGLSEKQIHHLLNQLGKRATATEKIALPLANEIRFVATSEIACCQSENNYTIFYLSDGEKIIVSRGLYEYQELLPADSFIRCHQSHLVNILQVKSFHQKEGACHLEMKNKLMVPVSRSRKELVRTRLLSSHP